MTGLPAVRRRTRLNLALAAAVALAGAAAWLAPSREVAAPALLTTLAPGTVRELTVTSPGREPLRFRRDGGAWLMEAPLRAPAHPRRMADLLGVAILPARPLQGEPADAQTGFGLDPPAATLRLDDTVIEFGATEPLEGQRYVRSGGKVALVQEHVFPQLQQGPGFFIDPGLLRPGLAPVHIELPGCTLARDPEGWRAQDGCVGLDAAAVVAAWQDTEANAVDTVVSTAAGAPVTIGFEGGGSAVFEAIFVPGGAVQLLRRDLGLRYTLDPGLVTQLGIGARGAEAH